MSRQYDLFAVNDRTGREEQVNSSALTHHEAVTMKSKFTPHTDRRIVLRERPPTLRLKHSRRPERTENDAEIIRGITKGPWADLWANQQEEEGSSFSGQNIYDLAPEPPRWAKTWGKKVASIIERINGSTLTDLYKSAVVVGYPHDAEQFGVHLGMNLIGHGIKWTDDVSPGHGIKIRVPATEFYDGVTSVDERFIRD
jgi:hypothetical protein